MRIILKLLYNRILKNRFRNRHITFRSGSNIDKECYFEGYNVISFNTVLKACHIGIATRIGDDSRLSNVEIGRFSGVGVGVYNTLGRHPLETFVSQHTAFHAEKDPSGVQFASKQEFTEHHKYADNSSRYVKIGNDVWIGANVTLLDGVTIGDGAVIGAGSVVTKDIEPYSVNVGVPTKVIKYRFDKELIDFLLEFKWWNKDFEWLKNNQPLFLDINAFYEKYKN